MPRINNTRFKFIVTTDVHGAILPYDYIYNKKLDYSLAHVAAYVKAQRKDEKQHVILLDNGDFLQGQPAVYYYNFEKTDSPNLISKVLNYLHYNAATIGNHDIEAGHAVYDKVRGELNMPWLAANAIYTATGEPYFQPYALFQKEGVKVAVLGLITPAIPNWLPPAIYEGIFFEDMINSAKKWVEIIKRDENPDILIGLFHSGLNFTNNNQTSDTPFNENASLLIAQQVPGFDVIFAGHDHCQHISWVTNSDGGKVLLLDADNAARIVAVADIEIARQGGKLHKTIHGELTEMRNYTADTDFVDFLAEQQHEIKQFVSKQIGVFTGRISTRDAIFGPSAFLSLIHKIQLEISGADISLAAPLSFDASIEAGPVFVSDMFKLYKYENLLYTIMLNGREILNLLEYSYALRYNTMKSENDYLMNYKFQSTGEIATSARGTFILQNASYNFESAAGIRYVVDLEKKAGNRIRILSMQDGTAFNLDKWYRVAINSYRGNGGGGHLTEGAFISKEMLAARLAGSSTLDLRFLMMKWIEKNGTICIQNDESWHVENNKWWERAKAREFPLLFGEQYDLSNE